MSGVIGLIAFILVVGVLMGLINTYAAEWIGAPFLKLANVVAIVACILVVLFWVLAFFGVSFSELGQLPHR